MTERSPRIYYHANCWDGLTAAWLFAKAYPSARLHPLYASAPPPHVSEYEGRRVFVLDYTFDRRTTEAMIGVALEFVCLDHHETNRDRIEGLPGCVLDVSRSGATLAYSYLHGLDWTVEGPGKTFWAWINECRAQNCDPQRLVEYVQDRDLWQWKLPHSREVSAYMRSFPLKAVSLDVLARLLHQDFAGVQRSGDTLLCYEAEIVRTHVRSRYWVEFPDLHGLIVPCVNASVLPSDVGNELCKGYPFSASWVEVEDGTRVVSLRSDKDGTDVGLIAKKYGGGGHPKAAGFRVAPDDPFPWRRVATRD